jgi:ribosome maturation factor RimP
MDLTARIAELLEEKFSTDEAFQDCFTVDIELKPNNRLNVFLDADSGISFDKCHAISRYLESFIDSKGWLGEKYVLEVSSPGLSRPLKFLRQYNKNIGRTLTITLLDKTQQTGILKAVDEQQVVLEQIVIEREGKKKKEVIVDQPVPFAQIDKAIVKVVF